MLEIRLLGQFDVRLDGESVEIPSRPAQSLLAYLALTAGKSHRREKLAGMLWPESDESNARSNLRHALWRTRKHLQQDVFEADNISIAFSPSISYWMDVRTILSLRNESDVPELQKAAEVYEGELLPGFYDDWVILERQRVRASYDLLMTQLTEKLASQGDWGALVTWGEKWLSSGEADSPEPAYRALMIGFAGLGDLTGMAAAFERCAVSLKASLDLEPSEKTKELYQRLIGGELPGPESRIGQTREEEKEDAVRSLVASLGSRRSEKIDIGTLSIIHASPREIRFDEQESSKLILAALHHDLDIAPWLDRAFDAPTAITAIGLALQEPINSIRRRRLVDALDEMSNGKTLDLLRQVALSDEAPAVRSAAAIAAVRRGGSEALIGELQRQISSDHQDHEAALIALVAIAEEVGVPRNLEGVPAAAFQSRLVLRKWKNNKKTIGRRTLDGAIMVGVLTSTLGALSPLFWAVELPTAYAETLGFVTLPTWVVGGALGLLLFGVLQAIVTVSTVNFAEVISANPVASRNRWLTGATSGLLRSALLFAAFEFSGGSLSTVTPRTSVFIGLYGIVLGLGITYAVPRLKKGKKASLPGILVAALTVAVAAAIMGGQSNFGQFAGPVSREVAFAAAMVLGIWIGIGKGAID